jgi:hypothetical protein
MVRIYPNRIKYNLPTTHEISYYAGKYNNAVDADNFHRKRGIRNMMAYMAVEDGALAEHLKALLKKEGRNPNTYPFLQLFVRGHVGNYIVNWFNPKFVDKEGDSVDSDAACSAFQKIWYANNDEYNYKRVAIKCIEEGLVYRGIEELVIKKPDSNPRNWNIAFENVRFDTVVFPPCSSHPISRNAKECWKVVQLTGKQIREIYPHKEDEILTRLTTQDDDDIRYEEQNLSANETLNEKKMSSKWTIVEYYHIENEKERKQYYNGIPIPDSGYSIGTPDDVAFKMAWGLENGILIEDEGLYTVSEYKPCLYLTSFSPDMGIVLDNRKDERQLNGFLPFYAWSYIENWGISVGLVDILFDLQQDINKRELAKTKALTETPINGKTVLSKSIMEEESDDTLTKIVEDLNDSSKPLITPDGVPIDSIFRIFPGTPINPALFNEITLKSEMADKLASLPLAMQGHSGKSGESGIAIGRKVIEGTLMQKMPLEGIIQHEHDKASDWLTLAPKIYGGRHNINRVFSSGTGETRKTTVINQLAGFDEYGNEVIKVNIEDIKRPQVIITQTKENDYMKQANLEMAVGALTAINASPATGANEPIRAYFESILATSMPFNEDIQKETAEEMARIRMEIAKTSAELVLKQNRMNLESLDKASSSSQQGGEMTPPSPAGPVLNQQSGEMPEIERMAEGVRQ